MARGCGLTVRRRVVGLVGTDGDTLRDDVEEGERRATTGVAGKRERGPGQLQVDVGVGGKGDETRSKEADLVVGDTNQDGIADDADGNGGAESDAAGIGHVGDAGPEEDTEAGTDIDDDGEELRVDRGVAKALFLLATEHDERSEEWEGGVERAKRGQKTSGART